MQIRTILLALAVALAAAWPAGAETALVAVATNFRPAAEAAAAAFADTGDHRVALASGATGKLAAQIRAGAPYDVFLSADADTPRALIASGHAVADSGFVYARGRLALWSSRDGVDLSDPAARLRAASHVAIANPALAPYGQAATEALAALVPEGLGRGRIVTAENVGQARALVATGAADLGFVAAASLTGAEENGSVWLVPETLHEPILQEAVLLGHGADNPAAAAFLSFLRGAAGRAIIAGLGYGLPD